MPMSMKVREDLEAGNFSTHAARTYLVAAATEFTIATMLCEERKGRGDFRQDIESETKKSMRYELEEDDVLGEEYGFKTVKQVLMEEAAEEEVRHVVCDGAASCVDVVDGSEVCSEINGAALIDEAGNMMMIEDGSDIGHDGAASSVDVDGEEFDCANDDGAALFVGAVKDDEEVSSCDVGEIKSVDDCLKELIFSNVMMTDRDDDDDVLLAMALDDQRVFGVEALDRFVSDVEIGVEVIGDEVRDDVGEEGVGDLLVDSESVVRAVGVNDLYGVDDEVFYERFLNTSWDDLVQEELDAKGIDIPLFSIDRAKKSMMLAVDSGQGGGLNDACDSESIEWRAWNDMVKEETIDGDSVLSASEMSDITVGVVDEDLGDHCGIKDGLVLLGPDYDGSSDDFRKGRGRNRNSGDNSLKPYGSGVTDCENLNSMIYSAVNATIDWVKHREVSCGFTPIVAYPVDVVCEGTDRSVVELYEENVNRETWMREDDFVRKACYDVIIDEDEQLRCGSLSGGHFVVSGLHDVVKWQTNGMNVVSRFNGHGTVRSDFFESKVDSSFVSILRDRWRCGREMSQRELDEFERFVGRVKMRNGCDGDDDFGAYSWLTYDQGGFSPLKFVSSLNFGKGFDLEGVYDDGLMEKYLCGAVSLKRLTWREQDCVVRSLIRRWNERVAWRGACVDLSDDDGHVLVTSSKCRVNIFVERIQEFFGIGFSIFPVSRYEDSKGMLLSRVADIRLYGRKNNNGFKEGGFGLGRFIVSANTYVGTNGTISKISGSGDETIRILWSCQDRSGVGISMTDYVHKTRVRKYYEGEHVYVVTMGLCGALRLCGPYRTCSYDSDVFHVLQDMAWISHTGFPVVGMDGRVLGILKGLMTVQYSEVFKLYID